ncbi:MAG: DUF3108 domain-containing protein [Gammaproteobacteria bacterium]|nr:DUF3108 domain-containing protein [Gammaproteobacteria bacterium]
MKKIIIWLSVCVMFFSQATEYKVKVKGTNAGKAVLNIATTDTTYTADLTLHPNMLAKMFGITDMTDSSKGVLKQGHFYPKTYRRVTTKGKTLFAVDFLGSQAKKTHKGKTETVKTNPLGQDPLAQITQIQADILRNQLASKYHLITEKSERVYSATMTQTDSEIQVTLTQTPDPKRILRLWFNKKGELLRMQKEKRGKIDFDMYK